MFLIRKFEEKDVPDCAMCFYESFFNCPLTENDRAFLCDYAQVLAEKCSFTYVAESEGQVVGFIIGHYKKNFDKALAKLHDVKPHYKAWLRCFFKFMFGGYKMSAPFKAQFDLFYKKLKENGKDTPLTCDCELMALCSRRDYRKGLGTALWEAFQERCIQSGVKTVRVFTDTDATYTFYEKRGFKLVWEKPYSFGTPGKSLVYEYVKKIFEQLQKTEGKIRQNDRERNEQRACTSRSLGVRGVSAERRRECSGRRLRRRRQSCPHFEALPEKPRGRRRLFGGKRCMQPESDQKICGQVRYFVRRRHEAAVSGGDL